MLTRANNKLRCHLSKPALGDVEPKLRCLADTTETVDGKWRAAVQNEGSALETSIESLRRNWAQVDIGQLQRTIRAATSAFKAVESDVTGLRSETHVVTEAARGRSQTLQSEANSLQSSVDSKIREQSSVQDTINSVNAEISNKEQAARELDDAAHSAQRRAKKKKKGGLLGAVVGIVAAPFTMGVSLAVTAVGIGQISSADDAFRKARDLRNSAAAQRNAIPALQAQVSSYQQEKTNLESQLQGKRQQLAVVQGFVSDVDSVQTDLYSFLDTLSLAVKDLQNFEVGLTQISQSADNIAILQSIVNPGSGVLLTPAARAIYDEQAGNWLGISGFLGYMHV